MLAPWKESCDKPRQYVKKQRPHFANKGPYNQSYNFSSSHENKRRLLFGRIAMTNLDSVLKSRDISLLT